VDLFGILADSLKNTSIVAATNPATRYVGKCVTSCRLSWTGSCLRRPPVDRQGQCSRLTAVKPVSFSQCSILVRTAVGLLDTHCSPAKYYSNDQLQNMTAFSMLHSFLCDTSGMCRFSIDYHQLNDHRRKEDRPHASATLQGRIDVSSIVHRASIT
jgi:hypothetical protein